MNVGSESQQIEVPLPLPVGPAGDIAIPYVIGKLIVTENRNSISYEFIPHEDECEDQITVFTSWNNVLDTDVHVYEPDLTHIWLYNRDQSNSVGSIVRANEAVENGPEIYQTKCGSLIPGNYDIRLNVYRGSESNLPTNANVLIRAGDEWFTKIVELNEITGSDGDSNPPVLVTIVKVTQNGSEFDYELVDQVGD